MAIRYPEYVKINNCIGDEAKTYRYLLEAALDSGENNKSALVIMKNPSKADWNKSDQTVNTVLEKMHEFKYTTVYIANLIPIYGSNPYGISDIVEKNKAIYIENDKIISEVSSKATRIFIAWGNYKGIKKSFFDKRINEITKILTGKRAYYYKLNTTGYPLHPGRGQWKTGEDSKKESDFGFIQF